MVKLRIKYVIKKSARFQTFTSLGFRLLQLLGNRTYTEVRAGGKK